MPTDPHFSAPVPPMERYELSAVCVSPSPDRVMMLPAAIVTVGCSVTVIVLDVPTIVELSEIDFVAQVGRAPSTEDVMLSAEITVPVEATVGMTGSCSDDLFMSENVMTVSASFGMAWLATSVNEPAL